MSDRRLRVLVAEDAECILDLIATRLEMAGLEVIRATDGHSALHAIATASPDAMVLDITMPGLDGFQVLERVHESAGLVLPPTLVLSARSQPGDAARVLALGARDYMRKPFDDRLFLARVARLFGRRRAAPERMAS